MWVRSDLPHSNHLGFSKNLFLIEEGGGNLGGRWIQGSPIPSPCLLVGTLQQSLDPEIMTYLCGCQPYFDTKYPWPAPSIDEWDPSELTPLLASTLDLGSGD